MCLFEGKSKGRSACELLYLLLARDLCKADSFYSDSDLLDKDLEI